MVILVSKTLTTFIMFDKTIETLTLCNAFYHFPIQRISKAENLIKFSRTCIAAGENSRKTPADK